MKKPCLVLVLLSAACDDNLFGISDAETGDPIEEGYCGLLSISADHCLQCHSTATAFGDLDLQTDAHAALVDVPSAAYDNQTLVVPGDPDASFLVTKLVGSQAPGEGAVMPPTGALPEATIDVVRAWISDGAPGDCDDTFDPSGRFHPANWAEPNEHGQSLKLQTSGLDCRDCHGDDLMGGSVAVSCDTCHEPRWRTDCTYCHGGDDTDGGAPPVDINNETDAISFPGHTSHVTESNHLAWDCTQCHVQPDSALAPGHLFDDLTPGQAELDFSAGLSPEAAYDGNGTCSNLYCHGNGKGPNGTATVDMRTPACDDCHPGADSPIADLRAMSGEHEEHLTDGNLECSDCHQAVADGSTAIRDVFLHVNGEIDVRLNGTIGYNAANDTCDGLCHSEEHETERWFDD